VPRGGRRERGRGDAGAAGASPSVAGSPAGSALVAVKARQASARPTLPPRPLLRQNPAVCPPAAASARPPQLKKATGLARAEGRHRARPSGLPAAPARLPAPEHGLGVPLGRVTPSLPTLGPGEARVPREVAALPHPAAPVPLGPAGHAPAMPQRPQRCGEGLSRTPAPRAACAHPGVPGGATALW